MNDLERRIATETADIFDRERTPEEETMLCHTTICSEIESIAKDMRLGVVSMTDGALAIVLLLKRMPGVPQ